jgi:hypothetical protein
MRAREFISESKLQDVHDYLDVASKSLPHTFVIPELQNNDFYSQYRFGVAIAAVRGEQGADHEVPEFRSESTWGQNQIVSSFDPELSEIIDKALSKINLGSKKMVSTPQSEEMDDTLKISPVKPFKGYKR